MKYSFKICYELDCPLAVSVAAYLDCEHYLYLHENYSKDIEIVEIGDGHYTLNIYWSIFGLTFGHTGKNRYIPPATFINEEIKPYPPNKKISIHNLIKVKTTLNYYETKRRTTLSELIVDLDIPFLLYPFRGLFRKSIEKLKILKDLEDLEMIERRAKLFGRNYNSDYLRNGVFILHKEKYAKYFGKDSEILEKTPQEYSDTQWINIKDLDLSYVKKKIANSGLSKNINI